MSEQQIEPTVIDLEPQAEEVKAPPVAENAEEPAQAEPDKPSDENKADKTFTQAELDEIVQKRINKLERKMEKQRIEQDTRAKVMQELQAKPEVVAAEPQADDYSDYAEYLRDFARYTVKQERIAQAREDADHKTNLSQQSEDARKSERQNDIIEEGNKKYDDFEDMPAKTADHLKAKGLKFAPAMVDTLIETDNAHEIVHYLYTNLAEAERIAKLSPFGQAKEIGKLEDKLLAKSPVKASNAPKPIEPIGSGTGSSKSMENMSPAEYIEHRKKQNPRWA